MSCLGGWLSDGRRCNDELLQTYGFSEDLNPWDSYVVGCGAMVAAAEVNGGSERLATIRRAGLMEQLSKARPYSIF